MRDKSKIFLDKSEISIVIKCTACPYWYGFALDIIEGWQVGARHQQNCHPGNTQASRALYKAKKDNERK